MKKNSYGYNPLNPIGLFGASGSIEKLITTPGGKKELLELLSERAENNPNFVLGMYEYNLEYSSLCLVLKREISDSEYNDYTGQWQSLCCKSIEQAIINTKETIKKQLEKIGIKIESIEELKGLKKTEFENKAKKIEEKRQEIKEKEERIRKKEQKIEEARQEIKEKEERIRKKEQKIEEARQKIEEARQKIEEEKSKIFKQQEIIDNATKTIKEKLQKIQKAEQKIEEARQEIKEKEERIRKKEQKIEEARQEIETDEVKKIRENAETLREISKRRELLKKLKEAEQKIEEAKKQKIEREEEVYGGSSLSAPLSKTSVSLPQTSLSSRNRDSESFKFRILELGRRSTSQERSDSTYFGK